MEAFYGDQQFDRNAICFASLFPLFGETFDQTANNRYRGRIVLWEVPLSKTGQTNGEKKRKKEEGGERGRNAYVSQIVRQRLRNKSNDLGEETRVMKVVHK